MKIKGRDMMNRLLRELVITERQIAERLQEPVSAIVKAVELADIIDKGIVLVGGGAMLTNMDTVLRQSPAWPFLSRKMAIGGKSAS